MGISKSITALFFCLLPRAIHSELPSHPIALSIPSFAEQKQPSDPLQQAENLLQSGQFDVAETQLITLSKTQAANSQLWFDLGFAQSHLGKNAEAIADYKKAVELSPKWFEASLNLGLAQAKAGNASEAAASLHAATELKPNSGGQQALGNAWLSLAHVLEPGSPKESLAAYQKAAELNPAGAEASLGAGRLMESQGDAPGAEKQYLTAAQAGNGEAVGRLVSLYLKEKRLPEAESWLRKYLASDPRNAAAQLQLARVLEAEDKMPEAISTLEAVNSTAPDPSISRELASLYLESKQYDAAASLLQDLAQKTPSDGRVHCDLGRALLHQHKYAEAEAELLQGLKLDPQQNDAYQELAFASQQNKDYQLAIRALDLRAQRLPENAATYWIRAVSYDSLGAFKPAAQNYKLFIEADGGKLPEDEFKARHRLKAIEH